MSGSASQVPLRAEWFSSWVADQKGTEIHSGKGGQRTSHGQGRLKNLFCNASLLNPSELYVNIGRSTHFRGKNGAGQCHNALINRRGDEPDDDHPRV